MAQRMICLSFDVDAMSGLVARGLTTPSPISRGEFGAVAVPRILDLLRRCGIRGTFFIPGVVIGTYPAMCERIMQEGHEIACHGWTHVPPAQLSVEKEAAGLERSIETLRGLTGKAPAGYRSPSWDLGPNTLRLLLEHGFLYESSMMGSDYEPYFVRDGDKIDEDGPMTFGTETPLVELPVSWSLDDFPHFEFLRMPNSVMNGLKDANGVLANWLGDFEYMRRICEWGILTYTFHPYVIGRGHRMLILEKLIEALEAGGAAFVTMEDAARAFLAKKGKEAV